MCSYNSYMYIKVLMVQGRLL